MIDAARGQSSHACSQDLLETPFIEWREANLWVLERALQLLTEIPLCRLAALEFMEHFEN